MLRISVVYPEQKVINLIANYEDYLEETGLIDIKEVKRREKLQNGHKMMNTKGSPFLLNFKFYKFLNRW